MNSPVLGDAMCLQGDKDFCESTEVLCVEAAATEQWSVTSGPDGLGTLVPHCLYLELAEPGPVWL